MKFHEYANLFPMMPEMNLMRLAEDIKEKGQSDPVITLDGMILDGRNRFKACEINGITPRCEAYKGDDPLGFVISHNLHRRHLTESQRAMVAAKWAGLKQGGDRGNQHTGGKSPIGGLANPSATATRDEAAALLNVGTSSIDRAKQIIKHGTPELQSMVENGEVSVDSARHVATMPQEEQTAIVSDGAAAIKAKAKAMRETPKKEDPAPEPAPKAKRVVTPYAPDIAEDCWVAARLQLDRIHANDKSRDKILKLALQYIENRLKNNN
jgi:ParB-like chromosome segregation protein Spo0J